MLLRLDIHLDRWYPTVDKTIYNSNVLFLAVYKSMQKLFDELVNMTIKYLTVLDLSGFDNCDYFICSICLINIPGIESFNNCDQMNL